MIKAFKLMLTVKYFCLGKVDGGPRLFSCLTGLRPPTNEEMRCQHIAVYSALIYLSTGSPKAQNQLYSDTNQMSGGADLGHFK